MSSRAFSPDWVWHKLWRGLAVVVALSKRALNEGFDLVEDAISHRFFQSLRRVNWSDYQLKPILVASVLINLLELASPLYINIVYSSVLPSGSMSSLVVLSVGVVILMLLGGWLKSVRLVLIGSDGARMEHQKRLSAVSKNSAMLSCSEDDSTDIRTFQ